MKYSLFFFLIFSFVLSLLGSDKPKTNKINHYFRCFIFCNNIPHEGKKVKLYHKRRNGKSYKYLDKSYTQFDGAVYLKKALALEKNDVLQVRIYHFCYQGIKKKCPYLYTINLHENEFKYDRFGKKLHQMRTLYLNYTNVLGTKTCEK
uniref:Uncharacterized protein n=1 Tax=Strongyloides stercoralis TaxID=6248 RepID=A0A0K0ERY6_STRER